MSLRDAWWLDDRRSELWSREAAPPDDAPPPAELGPPEPAPWALAALLDALGA